MGANLACFSQGCMNPVIGQCAGFQASCGRFYCAIHSKGILCAECSSRHEEKVSQAALAVRYQGHVQEIQRKANRALFQGGEGCLIWLVLLLVGAGIFAAGLAVDSSAGYLSYNYTLEQLTRYEQLKNLGSLSMIVGIIIIVVALAGSHIRQVRLVTRTRKAAIDDIVQQDPSFLEYYRAWTHDQRVKAAKTGLAILGIVIAGAAAAAASSSEKSREDERIRNAVDDELNRRG